MNTFYLFKVGDRFVRVTPKIKLKLVEIEQAAFWEHKSGIFTWLSKVQEKYPNAEIVEAKLTLK